MGTDTSWICGLDWREVKSWAACRATIAEYEHVPWNGEVQASKLPGIGRDLQASTRAAEEKVPHDKLEFEHCNGANVLFQL